MPVKVDRGRIKLRFSQPIHDRIRELAYALDVTVSSATALLLESSVKNTEFVEKNLDEQRLKYLNLILKYINQNNPYKEKVTIPMRIRQIAEEFMDQPKNIKQVLNQWIDEIVE